MSVIRLSPIAECLISVDFVLYSSTFMKSIIVYILLFVCSFAYSDLSSLSSILVFFFTLMLMLMLMVSPGGGAYDANVS